MTGHETPSVEPTGTPDTPTAAAPAAPPARAVRSMPALLGAGAVVVAVMAAVLLFGVARPPALPSIADAPAVTAPGRAVWTEWTNDRECLMLLEVDGTRRELRCGRGSSPGQLTGWHDGQLVLVDWSDENPHERRVDPTTGGIVSDEVTSSTWLEDRAESYLVTRDAGPLELVVGGRTVWTVDAPDAYDISWVRRSDDGRMLLIKDNADRLLLLGDDGQPRVWAEDVNAWDAVWEAAPLDPSGGVPVADPTTRR